MQDSLNWIENGEKRRRTIKYLINKRPIQLWFKIHPRNSSNKKHKKISLVRTAYAELKMKVEKINPSLVQKVNKLRDKHKSTRKLKNEIKYGILGGKNSRFKKVSSIKVIK